VNKMTREQVEAEVKAVNSFVRKKYTPGCDECNGTRKRYAPVYGDPVLDYTAVGPCLACCSGSGRPKPSVEGFYPFCRRLLP
jgi:hypothetical protein